MSAEIANVKEFFTSIQVHFSDLWIESCINWCKTEILPPNYTPKELQSKVYEQWLLLDLRDIGRPVLPPDLSTKRFYTLNGNFCLQMMQIVDISKPKFWQLQRIRNSNALTRETHQESETVGTGKRLLQATLSDGVQEVEAMEYKPVTSLSLNLVPGTKIRILGPVTVRRGRLMLEQRNVKVLGGEVEELLVSHAAENVLARWLKLPENPTPMSIEEKTPVEEKNEGFVSNVKIQSKPAPAPFSAEEEMLMAQEFDMLIETEKELNQTQTRDAFENHPNSLSTSLDDDNDDVFSNLDIDAHLHNVDKQRKDNLLKPNILSVESLIQKKAFVSKGIFRIKAKFKSVEEKLTMTDGEFRLTVRVEDSSGDLAVKVHSDVVAEFAECSVEEMLKLKSAVLGKNELAMQKTMEVIMRIKEKLLKLDNVLLVQIEKGQLPLIKKVV